MSKNITIDTDDLDDQALLELWIGPEGMQAIYGDEYEARTEEWDPLLALGLDLAPEQARVELHRLRQHQKRAKPEVERNYSEEQTVSFSRIYRKQEPNRPKLVTEILDKTPTGRDIFCIVLSQSEERRRDRVYQPSDVALAARKSTYRYRDGAEREILYSLIYPNVKHVYILTA
jgi:hypothetical protein